ncbi:phage tail spike protein [Lysinibacillus halotolerans]
MGGNDLMAILYKANESKFNHLGLGPLDDATSILVTEERNGLFELEMKYPITGSRFKDLKNDRIIKADAGHLLKGQLFKIIRISKPMKGSVTVYAEHISYLAQDLPLKPSVNYSGTAQEALNLWKASIVDEHPFTVYSDITTRSSGTWSIKDVKNARQALGGVSGSILEAYGGEYRFDNFHVSLLAQRGSDSGVLIAYGKNLIELNQEEEIDETYTSIYPYTVYTDDNDNEVLLTLPELFIDSEYVDNYSRRKILVVEFSNDQGDITVEKLRELANKYIVQNNIGVPKVNLKLQFVDLAKTLNYEGLQLFEQVNLCDWITVIFEDFGIRQKAKVIKTVWNDLLERYETIEVGELRAGLSESINTVVDGKIEKIAQSINIVQQAANGKNSVFRGPDEPTGNLKVGDLWYKPSADGETQMYQYNGIFWELILDTSKTTEIANKVDEAFQDAQSAIDAAANAQLRADQANQDAQNALSKAQTSFDTAQNALIQSNQAVTDASNAFARANEAFEDVGVLSARVDNQTGEISTIKQSVSGLQTKVSNAEGNISTLIQTTQGLQTRVEDAEGNISKLTQTATLLDSKITNLQIGGRNYALKSGEIRNVGKLYYLSKETLKFSANESLMISFDWTVTDPSGYFRINRVQVKSDGTTIWNNLFNGTGNANGGLDFSPNGKTSGRAKLKVDWPALSTQTVDIYLNLNATAPIGTFSITNLKLEKGTQCTDWTPAPEDIDQEFVGVYSQITQTADSINAKVETVDGRVTTLSASVNGITSRVSTAEGNISTLTQTTQGLQTTVSGKVDKTTYNSFVTQTNQALQSKLSIQDADAKFATQSELTQTANSLTIVMSQRNLSNFIPNPNFINDTIGNNASYWGNSRKVVANPDTSGINKNAKVMAIQGSTSANSDSYATAIIPVQPGQKVYLEGLVLAQTANQGGKAAIGYRTYNGSKIANNSWPSISMDASSITTWKKLSGYLTIPADGSVAYIQPFISYQNAGNTNYIYFSSLVVQDATSQAYTDAQVSILNDNINLKVSKNDVVNQINVSTEGILIDGSKVHITGTTTIDNGVIKSAMIASLSADKITTGTLNAANVNIINLNASNIVSGEINGNNITIRGGSSTDYTQISGGTLTSVKGNNSTTITGGNISSRGNFTRTFSTNQTAYYRTVITSGNGVYKISVLEKKDANGNSLTTQSELDSRGLYLSDKGLSTQPDNFGQSKNQSGRYIDLFAKETYNSLFTYSGMKLFSDSGLDIEAYDSSLVLKSTSSNNIESAQSSIFFRPMRDIRNGNNVFQWYVVASSDTTKTDGVMVYGSDVNGMTSGLRFSKNINDPTVYVTAGGGNISSNGLGTGNLVARNITGYQMFAHNLRCNNPGVSFYIGVTSAELAVTDNNLYNNGNPVYQPVRASNFYQSSSRDYKTNITELNHSGLAVINTLKVVEYDLISNIKEGIDDRQVGLIAEDSLTVATKDGRAINTYKLAAYNTKAIQEINKIQQDELLTRAQLEVKISTLESEVAKLKEKLEAA